MSGYPYTTVVGKIATLFEKMKSTGVPQKASNNWLSQIGLKSSNDRSLIPVLKFIGFVSDSGIPEQVWRDYRGKDGDKILADQIMNSYKDLFNIFPNANKLSDDELSNYFSTKTDAGEQVIKKTVSTFKSLVELANFENPEINNPSINEEEIQIPPTDINTRLQNQVIGIPSVNINVQLTLPENMTANDYDKFFAAMKKHLFTNNN